MADANTPDPKQAALLAAVAQSGSQAGNPSAGQNAAIQAANQRANQINAPTGFYQQQAAQIAEPYQTSAKDAATAAAAQSNALGSVHNTVSDYQREAAAALPTLDAWYKPQLDNQTNDNAFKKMTQQWQIEDRARQQQQNQLQDQAQQEYNAKQAFVKDLYNAPGLSQDAKDTFVDIIANSNDDYTTALSKYAAALGSAKNDADKKALQSLQPYLSQYFTTGGGSFASAKQSVDAQAAAAAQAQQQAAAQAGPKGPGFFQGINESINPFSSGFRNKFANSLRIGF